MNLFSKDAQWPTFGTNPGILLADRVPKIRYRLKERDSRERRDVTHDRCYSDYINTLPVGDTARLSALCCYGEQLKS